MSMSQFAAECEVCLDDMVEPRTLPCGHTYCKNCVQQLIDSSQTVTCPSDRRKFVVPGGNAHNLARNYFLENMLQNLRTTSTVAIVTCAEHADKEAEVFCERCMKSLCSKCVLKHNGHELSDYSASHERCALRIRQLQEDVDKFKKVVDNQKTAKPSAMEAQIAACDRKVAETVSKMREIAQNLNATADVLLKKAAQCRLLVQEAFESESLESLQREVAEFTNKALSFAHTADSIKLDSRFIQVEELTRTLEVLRGKLSNTNRADVSRWFSNNELKQTLETIRQHTTTLRQNITNDTDYYFSLQQLNAALNNAKTVVQSNAQTAVQTSSTSAHQWAATSHAAASLAAPRAMNTSSAKLTGAQLQQKNQTLIILGGWDKKRPLVYDTRSVSWAKLQAPLSCTRGGAAATVCKGKMVVAGGWSRNKNCCLNTVEQFDEGSNSWTALPDMLHRRQWLGLVSFCDTLFAIGGLDGNNRLNSVERFNSDLNQWQHARPLNKQRAGLCCAVLNVGILAAGGYDEKHTLDTCEVFDGEMQTWKLVASLVTARSFASAATLDDRVYVFGGCVKDRNNLDTCEEYNHATDKWTLLSVRLSVARRQLAAATVNGRVYICGGDPGYNVLENFDARAMQMHCMEPLPESIFGAAAVSMPVTDLLVKR